MLERVRESRQEPDAVRLVRHCAEPMDGIESVELGRLLDRVGDARVVLLGEATHGTAEFYRMRTRITRELILRRGFRMVAVEADWPDAAVVDRYVRHGTPPQQRWEPFSRFPTWMWRNRQVEELIQWLRAYNEKLPAAQRVGFHGMDMYSMFLSLDAVLRYLQDVDPPTAQLARERYACLTPWREDPVAYGRAALTGRYRECEDDVVRVLGEMLKRRMEFADQDGERLLDAMQNARLVASAERYYRIMYYGAVESWNLRDQHMFDTLQALLASRSDAKIIVWAHNSHLGDARATEMGQRGEHNVGQLCRVAYGEDAYLIGFGTDHGTVAAASGWDGPMQVMQVRPALERSYEAVCHASQSPAFLLALRDAAHDELRASLEPSRLERAIGVIYRPDTERQSHYFQAVLPRQFDEYIWFDETHAVSPLAAAERRDVPETYPFGL